MIEAIARDEVLGHWDTIEPLLQRILDRIDTGYGAEDILTAAQRGGMQVYRIGDWDAVAVTQLILAPRHSTLFVLYLAGDGMTEWFDLLMERIEQDALALGAKYVECAGRPGWSKVGAARGYREAFRTFRKVVNGR